jgi:hypothetical protein
MQCERCGIEWDREYIFTVRDIANREEDSGPCCLTVGDEIIGTRKDDE